MSAPSPVQAAEAVTSAARAPRMFSVRATAALSAVALLVGACAGLLLGGAVVGPGAGGPGDRLGGPPGMSQDAGPGAAADGLPETGTATST